MKRISSNNMFFCTRNKNILQLTLRADKMSPDGGELEEEEEDAEEPNNDGLHSDTLDLRVLIAHLNKKKKKKIMRQTRPLKKSEGLKYRRTRPTTFDKLKMQVKIII